MSETAPHENPLVPNKKLQQIYTAIVEARLLDEHIAGLQRKMKPRNRLKSTRGQEACRVSTAIELQPDDLISDAQLNLTMSLLFGAKPDVLLGHLAAISSGTKERNTKSPDKAIAKRQLPWIDDVNDRLKMALGAALVFKTLKQSNIVTAYIDRTEVSKVVWKQVLALAAELVLPIIFVVLPDTDKKKKAVNLCTKARSAGMPGIPVDSNDAVALYRVSQESIGRARGGDGAVLIDCIADLSMIPSKDGADDPVLHLKKFLIGRKVCSQSWANHAGDAFRRKIALHKSQTK